MPAALRLQGITLPVPDLAAAEKFYRWVLAMKAAEEAVPGEAALGWGKEDRVLLLDAAGTSSAREVIAVRAEALDPTAMALRLAEKDLAPSRVLAFEEDLAEMRDAWPDADAAADPDPAGSNRYVLSLESPADVRVDLHVPLPSASVLARGRHGPFNRRTKDWRGLENPGLLGATMGTPDLAALVTFLGALDIGRMDSSDPDAPFLVGDHQLRIEEREPPGIYGAAFVVAASRLPDLVRTLERFGVQHRLDRNHLLAVDPAGRILAVNGVRSG